jgi:hypothetical protein
MQIMITVCGGPPQLTKTRMSAFYYVLGVVAKMNASMWRFRINFLPINVLLVGALGFWGFAELNSAIEGTHNAATPLAVSLQQLHDEAKPAQNYVAVTGLDVPKALYEFGDKSASGEITRVETSWSPLVDTASQRMLLVQHSGKTPGGRTHEATVTGMLREMNSSVRSGLAAHHDTIQGLPVETRYVLVAGEHPADSISSALTAAVVLSIVALFIIATINRNTIFRRANFGSPVSKVKSADPLKVGATGTFRLEQEGGKIIEKRFVGMNAILAHLDNGNPALFANIDASSRFMGVTTSKRAGVWTLAVDAGSVKASQVGYLYWGAARRPALRFSYTSGGAKRQAVITTDDTQKLDTAVALLTTRPVPKAAPTS